MYREGEDRGASSQVAPAENEFAPYAVQQRSLGEDRRTFEGWQVIGTSTEQAGCVRIMGVHSTLLSLTRRQTTRPGHPSADPASGTKSTGAVDQWSTAPRLAAQHCHSLTHIETRHGRGLDTLDTF